MNEYKDILKEVQVPPGTGHRGFLRVIEEILKLPRIQEISINAMGVVSYRQSVPVEAESEGPTLAQVNFSNLEPYNIVRNSVVEELPDLPPTVGAPYALTMMLAAVSIASLYPLAFVVSPSSTLWDWLQRTAPKEVLMRKEQLYGLPLYTDRLVEDHVLLLCAGFSPSRDIADTNRTFKLSMPVRTVINAPSSDRHDEIRPPVGDNVEGVPAVGAPDRGGVGRGAGGASSI